MRFETEDLKALLDDDYQGDVDGALELLVERGLLRGDKVGHAFANEMAMTVAYRMVPAEDRTRLHKRAAENLRATPRAIQRVAYVAWHLELAGLAEDAAREYMAAATHAMHVGSLGDALHQLSRCLRLYAPEQHAERFAVHFQRVEALSRLGKRPQQLREIEALMREAEFLGEASKLAVSYAKVTDFRIEQGKLAEAAQSAEPALTYARQCGDALAEAEALRLKSSLYRLQGKSEAALKTCDAALALTEAHPSALIERAQILNNRGTVLWNMNRLSEAIECYAETLVIYKNVGRPRAEARSLNNMGIVFSALGESEAALAHYKSSLRIDQKLGDRAQIALKLGNIGQTYTELGDDVRGEKYLLKALKLCEAHKDRSSMLDVLNSLGQVYVGRGDLARARSFLSRGLEHARETHNQYQEIRSLVYLAQTDVDGDANLEKARDGAARAAAMAKAMPMPVGEMFALATGALACAKLEQLEDALERSRVALALVDVIEQGEGLESVLLSHTIVCEACELHDEAKVTIERGFAEVQRKAAKLQDPELRACYLGGKVTRAITKTHKRLTT